MKSQKKKFPTKKRYLLSFFLGVVVVLLGLFVYRNYLSSRSFTPHQVQPHNQLTQTKWQWKEFKRSDGSILAPAPQDEHKFILIFNDNGKFSSTTDCNQLSGIYSIDREALSIGEINSTLMACESENKEIIYRDALEKAASYSLSGNTLTLNLSDNGTMKFIVNSNHDKNYKRIFEGVLPCADCPGIKTTLTFSSEGQYIDVGEYMLEQVYLDRNATPLVTKGQWTVIRGTATNADATVYMLNFDKPNEETYFLQVDDTHVRQLNNELQEFPSGMNFTLTKKN